MSNHPRFQSRAGKDSDISYEPSAVSHARSSSRMSNYAIARSAPNQSRHTRQDSSRTRTPTQPPSHPSTFKQHSITTGTLRYQIPTTEPTRQPNTITSSLEIVPSSTLPVGNATTNSKQRTVGMFEANRAKTRRERTFIGGECAACEERLEHTLRGERILQFSCGHVAHEACFYEYIKDSDNQYCPTCEEPLGLDAFRGGSILDLSKLSSMVRAVAEADTTSARIAQPTAPTTWQGQNTNDDHEEARGLQSRASKDHPHRDSKDSQRIRIEKLGFGQQAHSRNNSENTSGASTGEHGRKHDYDLSAMETNVTQRHNKESRATIPPPAVTIRSEFPTLTRSRQQQSLTCLVTIEVPERKWNATHQQGRHLQSTAPALPDHTVTSPVSPRDLPVPAIPSLYTERELKDITAELVKRVDNWHGLEYEQFGDLRLHDAMRVGKNRDSWLELECYLFAEMLICVRQRNPSPQTPSQSTRPSPKYSLKGSILIAKHLKQVQAYPDHLVLTLNLSVADLPTFHLRFPNIEKLQLWQRALLNLDRPVTGPKPAYEYENDTSGSEDEENVQQSRPNRRVPSLGSSYGPAKTNTTAPTECSRVVSDSSIPPSLHIPVDVVVVIPVSSSMQGLKISLLKDTLRFLVYNLGERDRMGLATFGSSGGSVPLVQMTTKTWPGWNKTIDSIKAIGTKSLRADVVDGANMAMDLLMQRKAANPISSILLISDSSNLDTESVDFVVQRAEAARIGIYSFGLGQTHKPDNMLELSLRTKGSYLYVKDWMMLRECVAGVLGSLQAISHQGVRVKLKLPEGSPGKFVKITGALSTARRASGRDAEASLGDLRFGDKRDILVQLSIDPDASSQEPAPHDAWQSIVSGLEALGGPLEADEPRPQNEEEVPLLQADLIYGDVLREGTVSQLPRPSLLSIAVLPANRNSRHMAVPAPPIPPHPSIVQRRMELLTSDMLTRALTLVQKGQHELGHQLLVETRTILRGLSKGSLPPLPSRGSSARRQSPLVKQQGSRAETPDRLRDPSPHSDRGASIGRTSIGRASGLDHDTIDALDADLEGSLEWIMNPPQFARDSRKAVLQAIGVIASQRSYTFRSPSESIWAARINGVRQLTARSNEWREMSKEILSEADE